MCVPWATGKALRMATTQSRPGRALRLNGPRCEWVIAAAGLESRDLLVMSQARCRFSMARRRGGQAVSARSAPSGAAGVPASGGHRFRIDAEARSRPGWLWKVGPGSARDGSQPRGGRGLKWSPSELSRRWERAWRALPGITRDALRLASARVVRLCDPRGVVGARQRSRGECTSAQRDQAASR